MKQSPLFQLDWNDVLKGLIMAVGGGIMNVIVADTNTGNFTFNLTALWHGAIVGGVTYLVKNFFTPAAPVKQVTQTPDGKVTSTVVKTDTVDVTNKT